MAYMPLDTPLLHVLCCHLLQPSHRRASWRLLTIFMQSMRRVTIFSGSSNERLMKNVIFGWLLQVDPCSARIEMLYDWLISARVVYSFCSVRIAPDPNYPLPWLSFVVHSENFTVNHNKLIVLAAPKLLYLTSIP